MQADENITKHKLLNHLRHQAREKCADAIIKVEEKYVTRTTGVIFDDKKEEYVALMYTGIAVQTDNFTKTASTTTPNFSQNVKKEEDRDSTVKMVGTCLGIVTVVILLISGNN